MFVIVLRFGSRASEAPQWMAEHKMWLERGFARGFFLLSGSLQPRAGGAILAHGVARQELEAFIAEDPFVARGIVATEILEIAPGMTDDRLAFLKDAA